MKTRVRIAPLACALIVMSSCAQSSEPRCPPQFKRFTNPTFSLCYPWSWRTQSVLKKSERPPSHAPWLEFIVSAGDGAFFSVDAIPLSTTDFPPTMLDRDAAIDRYALENGFVSRMASRYQLHKRLGSSEAILNGWRVRNRILQGSMDGPSTYDAGNFYETRTPVTIGVTTGLVDDQVLLFTQFVPAALSVAVDTNTHTREVFRKIRQTVTINTHQARPR